MTAWCQFAWIIGKISKYVYAINSIPTSQCPSRPREGLAKLLKVSEDMIEADADIRRSGDYMKSSEIDPRGLNQYKGDILPV